MPPVSSDIHAYQNKRENISKKEKKSYNAINRKKPEAITGKPQIHYSKMSPWGDNFNSFVYLNTHIRTNNPAERTAIAIISIFKHTVVIP